MCSKFRKKNNMFFERQCLRQALYRKFMFSNVQVEKRCVLTKVKKSGKGIWTLQTTTCKIPHGKHKNIRKSRLLISNFRRVLNVVCYLLGYSPASEFYVPTFRKTVPAS